MYDFDADIADCAQAVETALEGLLTAQRLSHPGPTADRLVAAILGHERLAGGRRQQQVHGRQAQVLHRHRHSGEPSRSSGLPLARA